MTVKFIGKRRISFDSNTGDKISGTTLYIIYEDPDVEGFKADKVFVRDGIKIPDIKFNETINIETNLTGKPIGIYKVQ